MKILILSMLVLAMAYFSHAQNVTIPDANFKNALISVGVDTSGDGEISYAEAKAVTYLDVSYWSISDMTGIGKFLNLATLYCNNNQLTSLDFTNNNALSELHCNNNKLTSLKFTLNTALKDLYCDWNQLTSLDVSNNTALRELYCSHNLFTSLDITSTTLKKLVCNFNLLTSLDVTNSIALVELHCNSNKLTSLDVTNNTELTKLHCNYNYLTSLDVNNNTALIELYFDWNQLSILDIDNNTALGELYCNHNELISLDVTNNIALVQLHCNSNQLTSLDVTNNTALTNLDCAQNQLTSLDVSNNKDLIYLDFSNMFYLYGVCVWILPFPPAGIEIIKTDSPHVYFTTDCLSTATKPDKINSNLNIYPNPAKEYIVFDLTNNSSPAIVEIFGIQGKKMFEHKISGDNRLFISYLPKGIYLYRLYNNDNIYSGKITVE